MNKWFLTGCISFSFIFGLLIGASNSPIVGIAISSIFGIFLTIISLIEKTDTKFSFSLKSANFTTFGKILFFFSLFFIIGTFIGDNYRHNKIKLPNGNKHFVWDEFNSPQNTYEALDWIILSEKLKNLGFNDDNIKKIYKIRLKEISNFNTKDMIDSNSYEKVYDDLKPFNKIISEDIIIKENGRGLASIDNN